MFSVLFLAIVTLIKGFVCYDANANKLRISRNVIFSFLFLNQYFFSSHPNPISSSILLPPFDDVSSTPRFKPSIVYQRRRPLPLPSFAPPPDPILHEPHRSTRVSQPPDWYGFSSFTLQATLDTTYMPKSYSQASTKECWCQAI
jgi:hypothetical protein